MRQIKLPNDRETTSLGFGCSSLFRIPHAPDRQRLLDLVFDLGIRHFDVARMYGLGHAEAELGDFLRRHPGQLTVATKFGLGDSKPPSRSSQRQSVLRQLIQTVPGARPLARRVYGSRKIKRDFSSLNCRSSCETSLNQLGLESIDLLLLHEPISLEINDLDLANCLQQMYKEGLIGGYGISGLFETSATTWQQFPQLAHHLIQLEDSLFRPDPFSQSSEGYSALKGRFGRIRTSLKLIQEAFKMVPQLHSYWSDRLNIDLAESPALVAALLAASMESSPNDLVLFSSTNPNRLRRTLSLLNAPPWLPSDLLDFELFWRS